MKRRGFLKAVVGAIATVMVARPVEAKPFDTDLEGWVEPTFGVDLAQGEDETVISYVNNTDKDIVMQTYTGTGLEGQFVETEMKPSRVFVRKMDKDGNWSELR